jgi:DNA-binding NarL/FixJ family response regulator
VTAKGELLERDRELASLQSLIDDAADGQARLALVEGPAGIGKTRLVGEARRLAAEAGFRVLAARGGELEREFPFGVVRQLFEPLLIEPGERERALTGSAAAAATVFEAMPDTQELGDTSFAVLHGLYWLTLNLSADRPLLLAVDDLHWCDASSLRFLAYLVRRLEGLSVLVVASLRPAEPGADTALLGELASDPMAASLRPGTLSEESATELVRQRLGENADDAFAAACHTSTGGNPLLLGELLKAVESEGVQADAAHAGAVRELGPRAVSRTVLLRLARLPEETVNVARAVAVLGEGAEVAAVAAMTGMDEDDAARATEALARAEVLRPEPPLGFVHPLVREAVYRDISPGERELQHERAAQLLSHAEAAPERVAAHLLVIPPRGDPDVARALQEAGRIALIKGAAESAVAYLERALAEPPRSQHRAEVLFELGVAELSTSGPAAAEHLRGAYEGLREPARRGMAGLLLARTLLFTGAPLEGAALAREVADELPPELGDLRQGLEATEPIGSVFGGGNYEVLEKLERWRTESPGDGPGAKMLLACTAYTTMISGASAEESCRLALDALADGILLEADQGLFPIIAGIVLAVADRDESLQAFDRQLADAHRRGSLFGALAVHLWRGYALLRRGELPEAEESLTLAGEETRLYGATTPTVTAYHHAFLASAQVERGNLEAARESLETHAAPVGSSDGENMLRWSLMEVLLAEGRAEEALAVADEYERSAERVRNPSWAAWRSLKAQALDRLDRTDEAIALAEEELRLARGWGAPGTVGRTLITLGRLKRDEGRAELEEAVAVLETSSARLAHAKALAGLGSLLRRQRKPSEAREPLRRALELAGMCGATGLEEEVRSELHAAGARPRTTALSGVEALTASERRVAGLAADGQTNRDIAQSLFVTPKTVEVHLSNTYRKLGIRSRRELAGALEPA